MLADPEIRERIALLRYPAIYLVIFAHIPSTAKFLQHPGVTTFIGTAVADVLIYASIPTLTFISGLLLFNSRLDLKYPQLLRKRGRSLLLPMVAWNLPLALALFIVQWQHLLDYSFDPRLTLYPIRLMTWLNAVFSITDYPIVFPLHFLRDLFLCCLLAPLVGWVIRRAPIVGLAGMVAIMAPDLDGELFRNNTIPVNFYMGGMAALGHYPLKSLDRYAWYAIPVLVAVCAVCVVLELDKPFWLRLLAPPLVWPMASLVVGTPLGRWLAAHSGDAIFLFMCHGLLLMVIHAAYPAMAAGPFPFWFWLVYPMAIAGTCFVIGKVLQRWFRPLYTLLIGMR